MKSETTVKHVFDDGDFDGAGHYLVRSNQAQIKDDRYLTTIMYKVGYCRDEGTSTKYGLVSMSDGWTRYGFYRQIDGSDPKEFVPFLSKKDLIDHLNSEGSYRMATKDEVIRAVSYQKFRWIEKLF